MLHEHKRVLSRQLTLISSMQSNVKFMDPKCLSVRDIFILVRPGNSPRLPK